MYAPIAFALRTSLIYLHNTCRLSDADLVNFYPAYANTPQPIEIKGEIKLRAIRKRGVKQCSPVEGKIRRAKKLSGFTR